MKPMIVKPIISEKSMAQAAAGKYLFAVPKSANKIEVGRVIAKDFKVTVLDVNIMVQKGKVKTLRRVKGTRKDVKKAIVTLKKGDKIAAFELEEAK